jgi:hypothetical protein
MLFTDEKKSNIIKITDSIIIKKTNSKVNNQDIQFQLDMSNDDMLVV